MTTDIDEVPEEAHQLARRWVDTISADLTAASTANDAAYHALSVTLVSVIACWMRSQQTAADARALLHHVAQLVVDGIEVGAQLFNEDHAADGEHFEPPRRPRIEPEVKYPPSRVLPRRRPPRSRPC